MIAYVLSCWDDEAGERSSHYSGGGGGAPFIMCNCRLLTGTFGAHPGHDGHILATLSAVQIMAMQGAIERIDSERVVKCESLVWNPAPQTCGAKGFG